MLLLKNLGKWASIGALLLIPVKVVFTVIYLAYALSNPFAVTSGDLGFAGNATAILCVTFWLILIPGIVAYIAGRIMLGNAERKVGDYAGQNGWMQVSQTMWVKHLPKNLTMTVQGRASYWSLLIESPDDRLNTPNFSQPIYALRFADTLYREVISRQHEFSASATTQASEYTALVRRESGEQFG